MSECRGCQEIEIAADREIACLNDEIRRLSAKVDAALLVADDHAVARMQKSRALEMFENHRKLAHSLRAKSIHVAAFVEAIGVEMDKILKPKAQT